MPKLLRYVDSRPSQSVALLRYWDGRWIQLELDSPAWFEWLTQECSFRYTYYARGHQEGINFTVRAEKRGQRTYWQGWKTMAGQTTKKYLGASAKLTRSKLDTVGSWFAEQVSVNAEPDQNRLLYMAATDLIWLVERLIEGCGQPQLAQQARRKLDRIKREVDEIAQALW